MLTKLMREMLGGELTEPQKKNPAQQPPSQPPAPPVPVLWKPLKPFKPK